MIKYQLQASPNNMKKTAFLILLILLLLQPFFIFSFELPDIGKIHLVIASDRKEYLLGEPVFIHVGLANFSDRSIEYNGCFEPESGCFNYNFADSSGKSYRYEWFFADVRLLSIQVLKAGEIIEWRQILLYHIPGFVFPKLGNYTITATYKYNNKEALLTSNSISIKIVNPTESQKNVQKLFYKDNIALAVVGMSNDKNALQVLATIVEKYPKSRFVPYALYTMARPYLHTDRSVSNWKEERRKGIKLLQKLMDSFPDSSIYPHTAFLAVMTCYETGDYDDAEKEYRDFLRKYPKSYFSKKAKIYIDEIQRRTQSSNH